MPHQLDPFVEKLAGSWPIPDWRDVTVLLAVSGGPDSMALARGMLTLREQGQGDHNKGAGRQECLPHTLGEPGDARGERGVGRLVVAHFNHGLRPGHAQADEAFVVRFCREHGLPCHVGRQESGEPAPSDDAHLLDDSSRRRLGFEAAARRARYKFLRRKAEQIGARYIATAHTADDQAETILHNIVRGTGLAGMSGIPRCRALGSGVVVVRPMLEVRRSEVLDYLSRLQQPYCTDSTNADPSRARNRIRHDLLPRLEADYNARVVDALVRLGKLTDEAQRVVSQQAEALTRQCVAFEGTGAVRVDCGLLADTPEYLLCEMLKSVWRRLDWPEMEMGYDEWTALAALARGESCENGVPDAARTDFPGGIRATRMAGKIVLRRRAT